MKNQLPTEKLNAGHLEKIWMRRRIYAFVVTTFAVFMILVLSWSVNVRAFRVDNDMRFRIQAEDEEAVANFKDSLLSAMKDSTSNSYLVRQIGKLRETAMLDSPYLSQSDLDSIRSRIQVYTKFNQQNTEVAVKISFFGKGSKGEEVFINKICEDLIAELRPANDFSQVDMALTDVKQHLKKHVSTQNRFSASLKSMIDDVEVKLATIDARMQNVWQNQQQPAAETLAETKLKTRRQQLERLKTQKDELLLEFESDPRRLAQLDRQIEIVRFEIKQIELDTSPYGFSPNPRFQNVSFIKSRDTESEPFETQLLSNLSEEVQGIQLDGILSSIDTINSHRRDDLQAPIAFLDKITGNLSHATRVIPAASLLKPGVVTVRPMGGKPSGGQMFFLTMLAIVFGSIVAWQINPTDVDRGFSDTGAMTKTLGVPVVSSFQLKSPREKSKQGSVSIRLVRICEIAAMALVAVVVLACLFSPGVRNAMLENPLDGLARIVGLFRKT